MFIIKLINFNYILSLFFYLSNNTKLIEEYKIINLLFEYLFKIILNIINDNSLINFL